MNPNEWLDLMFSRIAEGGPAAPALGLLVGVLLTLNPVALPAMPAVVTMVAPALHSGARSPRKLLRAWATTGAFVLGMDAPLAVAGYVVVEIAILLIQASLYTSIAATVVLAAMGLRLLLRRSQDCHQRNRVPLNPGDAFGYGMAFSVTGCAGCAPLLIALGGAAAYVGGPLTAAVTLLAFLVARTTVLFGATVLAGRLLTQPRGARAFDVVVGSALLLASAYYAYRIASGQVTGVTPGDPASGVLP